VAHDLEYPGAASVPDWGSLYRARGDEVAHHRPIFTGDVFERVPAQGVGRTRTTSVIVLLHPCALRSNGVDLQSRLMVGEVRQHKVISVAEWTGYFNTMPLPDLNPSVTSGKRHQAAFFDELYLVGPDDLDLNKRVACMSQTGGQPTSAAVGALQQPGRNLDGDLPGGIEPRLRGN
jgi:hypothetical protein